MRIPKRYGQSRIDVCPFCRKQATTINKQNIPVCITHKEGLIDGLKCVCGSTLDILNGKFGVFFSCMKCGNMNLRKVLEFNTIKPASKESDKKSFQKNSMPELNKETIIKSDDPLYFD